MRPLGYYYDFCYMHIKVHTILVKLLTDRSNDFRIGFQHGKLGGPDSDGVSSDLDSFKASHKPFFVWKADDTLKAKTIDSI